MKKYLVIVAVTAGIAAILLFAVVWYPFIQQYRVNAHLSNAKAYQRDRKWQQMEAELREAIALRPDSEEAWQLLAWNYCYNLSEEFKRVEDKYATIRRGIEIAIEGASKNPHSAQLHWSVGWDFFHRIAKATQSDQFRRLFAEDDALHDSLREHVDVDAALGPDGKPDNFLVAKLWFAKASGIADRFGLKKEWMGPAAFHSYPALSQTNFALAIENEGASSETAIRAWQDAAQAWYEYGDREITYSAGKTIRFNDLDRLVALQAELEEQKKSAQSDAALISQKMQEVKEQIYWTDRFRTMINFSYWPDRCRLEQTEPWLAARRMMFEARQTVAAAHSSPQEKVAASELFESAFAAWAHILKDNPNPEDDLLLAELLEQARFYRATVLDDEPLPLGFPLRDLIEEAEKAEAQQQAALQSVRNSSARRHPAGRGHGSR